MSKRKRERLRPDQYPIPPAPAKAPRPGDDGDAARARAKLNSGGVPTQRELAAMRRIDDASEVEARWRYYQAVPIGHYQALSGRQSKIIHEQATRYGLPIHRAQPVNLFHLLRAFHDLLAEYKRVLGADPAEADHDPSLFDDDEAGSKELERYRAARADMAELDRDERVSSLIPRDELRDALGRFASAIRQAGEALQRAFGVEAQEMLNEAIDDGLRAVTELVQE